MITISYELFRYILDSKLIFPVAKLKKKQNLPGTGYMLKNKNFINIVDQEGNSQQLISTNK